MRLCEPINCPAQKAKRKRSGLGVIAFATLAQQLAVVVVAVGQAPFQGGHLKVQISG
jgi:hypothetical protein